MNTLIKFLTNSNDEKSPCFYLIKALESLCIGDNPSFFIDIDRFRFEIVTFDRYEEVKEKFSLIFQTFDENQLYSYFENFGKTL
jgi:hypothetical protein